MEFVYIILAVCAVLALFVIATNNTLVKLRNMVRNQWSQIDVLLKRRADLIPNLVESVKGYAGHEKETLDAVISARNKVAGSTNTHDGIAANTELSSALSKLMVVVEAYPDLKANQNFLQLQDSLRETEDKISYARQFYNDAVNKYNDKTEMFPSNVIASMFRFEKAEFFKATEEEKETPQVKF